MAEITFAEYLQEVAKVYNEERKLSNNMRLGQTYWNVLFDTNRELAYELAHNKHEVNIDPYYNDNNLADFLAYLEVMWK